MISQPMNGLTDEEIEKVKLEEAKEASRKIEEMLNRQYASINIHHKSNSRLHSLCNLLLSLEEITENILLKNGFKNDENNAVSDIIIIYERVY